MKDDNKNFTNNKVDHEEKGGSCRFKKLCKSRSFIILSSVILGVVATLAVQNINKATNQYFAKQKFNNFYNWPDHNFEQMMPFEKDPFEEMELMENRMNEIFKHHRKYMMEAFNNANNNVISTSKTAVLSREDENYYYYELSFSGFKKGDIRVDIKDRSLSFASENKKFIGDKDQKSHSHSSFYYSFSVPEYDTKKAPEIVKQDDKIVVKFSKKVLAKGPAN